MHEKGAKYGRHQDVQLCLWSLGGWWCCCRSREQWRGQVRRGQELLVRHSQFEVLARLPSRNGRWVVGYTNLEFKERWTGHDTELKISGYLGRGVTEKRRFWILQDRAHPGPEKDHPTAFEFSFFFNFLNFFICLFLDRGEGRGREGEKHQCVVAPQLPPY